MSVSDEEQRMLIVLVSLNKVVAPVLQQFTEHGMDNHYRFLDRQLRTLKPACSLSTLTYPNATSDPRLKLLIRPLEFGNINSNFDTHGRSKNMYDYKVISSIDLAKLYLPTYLAKFSAFDKSLDVSAMLRLLGIRSPAPIFLSSHPVICVQTIADDVRDTVRNKAAHFNEFEWTETFFQECFAKMETLVKSIVLPDATEKTTLDELSRWKNQGFKLIVQRDVKDLFEEFTKTKMEDEVKTKFCKLLQKMPTERMMTERFNAVDKMLQDIVEGMKELKTVNQLYGTVCKASAQNARNGVPLSTANIVPVDSTSAEKCKPKDEESVDELSQGSIGVIPDNCSDSVEVDPVNGACCEVSVPDGSNNVSLVTTKIEPLDSTSAEICKPKDEESSDELSQGSSGEISENCCNSVEVDLVNDACCEVSVPDGSNSVSLLTTKIVPLDSTSAEICKPKDEESSDELSQGSSGEISENCCNYVEDLAKDPSALQICGCPKLVGISPSIVYLKRPPVPFVISFAGTLPDNVGSGTAEFVNLEHCPVKKDDDCLFGRAVPTSPREGVFKVRVYSQDNSFMGETEIVYLDIIEEVLAQAMRSRTIMAKVLEAASRCLQEDSEGIIGNKQESSKVGFSSEWKSSLSVQLIQRLVFTAAKLDALWLIQIIFNLPAGRIVFDSYRSRSLLPEYVAIANGHMEIAQYLQDVAKRFSSTEEASELQSNTIDWQEIIAAIKGTQDQPIPQEIQAQGHRAEVAFKEAMEKGSVEVYRGRIMLIGQDRAGKTSLKKSLLGLPFDPEEESTVGIEVDPTMFEVEVDQVMNWQFTDHKKLDLSEYREDIARITAEHMRAMEGESKETTDSMDLGQELNDPSRLHDVIVLPKIEEKAEGFEQSDSSPTIDESASDSNQSSKAEIDPSASNVQENDMQANQDVQLIDTTAGLTLDDVTEKVEQCLQGLELNDNVKAKEIILSVWDFAGQNLYYASHSVFLSHRAVYVLVHNLSKDLSARAEPYAKLDTRKIYLENPTNQTNLDNLLSWLVSVHCIRPTRDEASEVWEEKEEKCLPYLRPPVFVVGTHADKPFKDIRDTLQYIQDNISGTRYDNHVIRPLYAVDNTRSASDYGVQALQNRISEVLKQEPYMGEKVPIRWFHFEKVVEALVANKIYHMELNELLKYTKQFCHIDKEDELETMLKFYHDLGVIVKHGRTVVLQALWLIDLFKQLINVRPYDERDPWYVDWWQELKEKGILRMDLVDHVFTDFIQKDLFKQDILKMMEDHGLIAKFSFLPADGDYQQKYFVPSLLKSLPLSLCEIKPSDCDPCPLYLHFLDGFVPHGLFAQLVSRCIVWCSGCSPEIPELFQNGAMFFRIGKQRIFDLVLICRKRFIKIILTQNPQAPAPSTTYSATKAHEVRVFLESTLKDMREELSWLRDLRYELCFACTHCLKSPDQCIRHGSVRCADDDCLHLLPFRSEEQLTSWKNYARESDKTYGLEKWLLVHEKESEERKMVSGNSKGPSVKRKRVLPASSAIPPKLTRSDVKQRTDSPCTSLQRPQLTPGRPLNRAGPAVKRKRESPGSSCVKHPRRTHPVKEGSPDNDDLERLANQIINFWKKLGRRLLESDEALLDAFHKDNDKCSEKAYKMLLKWKAAKGSDATFRVLHDALCHDIINRRDLAEKFCLGTDY